MSVYAKNSPAQRTVRPVLRFRPWGRVDTQALPPPGWCARCGAEVYKPEQSLCHRCNPLTVIPHQSLPLEGKVAARRADG